VLENVFHRTKDCQGEIFMLELGAALPDVTVPDDTDASLSVRSLVGTPVVLFFYPKDDTPGCTSVASQFRDLAPQFAEKGIILIGVSRDSADSHRKFKEKYELPMRLLADTNSDVCNAFGVIVEKNMYGKKSMGVQRSTFYFDAEGLLKRIWPKVTVEGHAEDVLAAIS
jgi:peroxiredoxin Q/BCP